MKGIGVLLMLVACGVVEDVTCLGARLHIHSLCWPFSLPLELWGMWLGRGGFGTGHVPDVGAA